MTEIKKKKRRHVPQPNPSAEQVEEAIRNGGCGSCITGKGRHSCGLRFLQDMIPLKGDE